jgi:transposase-like protein
MKLCITLSFDTAFPARFGEWMEHNRPEGLTVFSFPAAHRRRIRTTNGLERVSQEIRRRTRVVWIFPNEASCLRLVSALLNGDKRRMGDRPTLFDF